MMSTRHHQVTWTRSEARFARSSVIDGTHSLGYFLLRIERLSYRLSGESAKKANADWYEAMEGYQALKLCLDLNLAGAGCQEALSAQTLRRER